MRQPPPTRSAPSATGRQQQGIAEERQRARRPVQIGAGTDTPDPRCAREGHHRSVQAAFWTVRPFSFRKSEKENGGASRLTSLRSRIMAAGRRPKFPRAVCNLPYTPRGGPLPSGRRGRWPLRVHERIYPPRVAAPQQIIRGDAEVIRKKAKRQRWDIDLSIFHSLIMDKGT